MQSVAYTFLYIRCEALYYLNGENAWGSKLFDTPSYTFPKPKKSEWVAKIAGTNIAVPAVEDSSQGFNEKIFPKHLSVWLILICEFKNFCPCKHIYSYGEPSTIFHYKMHFPLPKQSQRSHEMALDLWDCEMDLDLWDCEMDLDLWDCEMDLDLWDCDMDLDLWDCEMDLDLWDCFGREKLIL